MQLSRWLITSASLSIRDVIATLAANLREYAKYSAKYDLVFRTHNCTGPGAERREHQWQSGRRRGRTVGISGENCDENTDHQNHAARAQEDQTRRS